VQRLAALCPIIVAPGHGQPMKATNVAQELQTLADRFDEIARPLAGRYVERPVRG
jgi:hypothetical protein